MNENELVAGCKAGDPQSVRTLAEAFYERVFRVAFSLTTDQHLAEDLTQETFTASLKAIQAFRGESGLFTWLVAILRRQWMNRRRSDGRMKVLERVAEEEPAPEEDKDRAYAREELTAALERLDEDSRTVLTLFHVEELKYDEIAKVLQTPVGTVKSRLHEARRKLKSLIHAV